MLINHEKPPFTTEKLGLVIELFAKKLYSYLLNVD